MLEVSANDSYQNGKDSIYLESIFQSIFQSII